MLIFGIPRHQRDTHTQTQAQAQAPICIIISDGADFGYGDALVCVFKIIWRNRID